MLGGCGLVLSGCGLVLAGVGQCWWVWVSAGRVWVSAGRTLVSAGRVSVSAIGCGLVLGGCGLVLGGCGLVYPFSLLLVIDADFISWNVNGLDHGPVPVNYAMKHPFHLLVITVKADLSEVGVSLALLR